MLYTKIGKSIRHRTMPKSDENTDSNPNSKPASADVPAVLPPVVPSPSELPFTDPNFSDRHFEKFCADLISHRYENKSLFRYGRPGDKQYGIDIYLELSDGLKLVCQCKQYKEFSKADLRSVVSATTFKADRYLVLVGCRVGAQVRDECAKLGDMWELWDGEDITREVRKLDKQRASDLVRNYFGKAWSDCIVGPSILKEILPLWHVPYARMRNFVGRERLIQEIRETLVSGQRGAVVQALTGSGGVGKTQLCVEYAYQFEKEYDLVWWFNSEEQNYLKEQFAQLAGRLNLVEYSASDTQLAIEEANKWLNTHQKWLLIFDNAENPSDINHLLPQRANGHVVITSRNPAWKSIAKPITLNVWHRADSVQFVLSRTDQSDTGSADRIANVLGDLPMALEQACAYIEEVGLQLVDYLKLYEGAEEETKVALLNHLGTGSDRTVATTIGMAVKRLPEGSKALLNLLGYLAPEDVPVALISAGKEEVLGAAAVGAQSDLLLNDAIAGLMRYSLLQRLGDSLSIHRLLQLVTRAALDLNERKHWAEIALKTLEATFPKASEGPSSWPECARLLPHAQAAADHGESVALGEQLVGPVLYYVGSFLIDRGRFDSAEQWLVRAVRVIEKSPNANEANDVLVRTRLALVYMQQARYGEADAMFRQALKSAIRLKVANGVLNHVRFGLAELCRFQEKYTEAEQLFTLVLNLPEGTGDAEKIRVADVLQSLALVSENQRKYLQAEQLYYRALTIYQNLFGSDHWHLPNILNSLAWLLYSQKRFEEAEPLYRRSISILEREYGSDHYDLALVLNNFAELCRDNRRYVEAESLHRRSLEIRETVLGPVHPDVAQSLNNLAGDRFLQNDGAEAESLLRRALKIMEQKPGASDRLLGSICEHLALVLQARGEKSEAKTCAARAAKIFKSLGTRE
jgi:tetratricopeptide (TPR) repeat protein